MSHYGVPLNLELASPRGALLRSVRSYVTSYGRRVLPTHLVKNEAAATTLPMGAFANGNIAADIVAA
jgi:hypothetical protein